MKLYDDLGLPIDDTDVMALIAELEGKVAYCYSPHVMDARRAKPWENQLRIVKTLYKHIKQKEPAL